MQQLALILRGNSSSIASHKCKEGENYVTEIVTDKLESENGHSMAINAPERKEFGCHDGFELKVDAAKGKFNIPNSETGS